MISYLLLPLSRHLGLFIALLLGGHLAYHGIGIDLTNPPSLLVSVAVGIAVIGLLLLSLSMSAMQRSEEEMTPGILLASFEDPTVAFSLVPGILFMGYSLSLWLCWDQFPSYPTALALWVILLGASIDAYHRLLRRVCTLMSPTQLLPILSNQLLGAFRAGRVDLAFRKAGEIGEICHRAIWRENIPSSSRLIRHTTELVSDSLDLARQPGYRPLAQNLEHLLATFCESFELTCLSSIKKQLVIPCENALHSLRIVFIKATLSQSYFANIPLGCLHRCTDHVRRSGIDSILVSICCTQLADEISLLTEELGEELSPRQIHCIADVVRFLDYFADDLPTGPQESLSKTILLNGFGRIARTLMKEPLSHQASSIEVLQLIHSSLLRHLKAKYAQKDILFYQRLLELSDSIYSLLPEEDAELNEST